MARLPQYLARTAVGRQPLSREVLAHHQRQRILDAATEVFAKRGYQATTVDNIVSAAKIGVGSFYANFDGKEECLLAAYEQIVSEARQQIARRIPADGNWEQKALAALHELLVLVASAPLKGRLALVEIQTGGPVALRRYGETLEFAIVSMEGGRKAVAVDPPPLETHEAATVNGLAWLLTQRLVRGEARGIEQLFGQMAEVILDPYLGAAGTKREIAAFNRALASN